MSLRNEQCRKVCRILDDVLANRPTERDALIVAVRTAFDELKERKTGRWMATEADEPCFYRCSECGRLIDERENYCPNCGARMKGERR